MRHYVYDTNEGGRCHVGSYYYDVFEPPFIRNVAKGFLWLGDARGGTLVDLQDYLASLGQPALNKWLNVVVVGVSAEGRYLVGFGDDAQGRLRGWRIDFGRNATGRQTRCQRLRVTRAARARQNAERDRSSSEKRAAGIRVDAGAGGIPQR